MSFLRFVLSAAILSWITAPALSAEFHAGGSVVFFGGEDYTNGVGGSGRIGYTVSDIHSFEFEITSLYEDGDRGSADYEGNVVPLIIQYRVTPLVYDDQYRFYIGVGVGFAWIDEEGSAPGIGEYVDDIFAFAYQGFAGVLYDLNDTWQIQTGYRYMQIEDATIAGLETRESAVHLFEIGAHFRF